jgi:hypothetical protein
MFVQQALYQLSHSTSLAIHLNHHFIWKSHPTFLMDVYCGSAFFNILSMFTVSLSHD